MTFPRKLGILLVLVACTAIGAYHAGLALPSLRWFYSFGATPDQIEAAEQQLYTLAESGTASSGFVSFGDALRGAVHQLPGERGVAGDERRFGGRGFRAGEDRQAGVVAHVVSAPRPRKPGRACRCG